MMPSQLLNMASLALAMIGGAAIYWIDSKELAFASIVLLALVAILQSDLTKVVAQGAAIIASKLLTQAVELRDQLEELEEIVREAAQDLHRKDEAAALNTLTAGVYLLDRRQNG
jgi:hypothetical protein